MTPNGDDLDAVLAAVVQAAESGAPFDEGAWAARYPAYAADIAEFRADLARFRDLLGFPTPAQSGSSECERCGDYELLSLVGTSGTGQVYRARRVGTELIVALKRIRPDFGDDATQLRSLAAEVNAAAGLKHPHIVGVYHFGVHDGQPFYTMELAAGALQQAIGRFPQDIPAAAGFLVKVARAVHFAHSRGILHRDLKPANILLDERGEPRVADLGLAVRISGAGRAETAECAGTLAWMAPEVLRREPALTTAVDVWSLGVTFYEMLTGKRPFAGESFDEVAKAIRDAEPADPRSLNPAVDIDLAAICLRCLRKDPEARYESASALALDLERWQHGEPVRARPLGRAERIRRWCARHPALLGAIVLTGLALLTVAGIAVDVARRQEERLTREACRANQFAARHVAGTIKGRLRHFGDSARTLADDPALAAALPADKVRLVSFVWQERERLNQGKGDGAAQVSSLFVLDAGGFMLASSPADPSVLGEDFGGRDYFLGALRRIGEDGPERVYVSRVYHSENDGLEKLALAVAVRSADKRQPAGVVVVTLTTDASLGLDRLHDEDRKAVLLALLDTNPARKSATGRSAAGGYLVLVHPAYRHGEEPVAFLRPFDSDGLDENYADPVAATHPDYAGRWLAGFAPVEGTELIVLVQQRRDAVVEPVQGILRRAFLWIGAGFAALLSLVGVFVMIRQRVGQSLRRAARAAK
jgi:hypothetical protein